MTTFSNSADFYRAIHATAQKLEEAGLCEESKEVTNAMYGTTGGDILGALGAALKRVVASAHVPQDLLLEMKREIDTIDEAFDKGTQPRPRYRSQTAKVVA